METDKYYRASEIHSHPEIQAQPAINEDEAEAKGIKARYARSHRPARRGLLPISETHFYRLLKAGKFPAPDAELNGTLMWTGALIQSTLAKRDTPDGDESES